jgi:hypothetical protein
MPIIENKFARKTLGKKDQSFELDRQLSKLEEDIRRLKIEFDIYFNGATKRPPLEARARVESMIKRLADNRSLTYAQRYYYNGLIATYTSYRELWRRTLRARGEDLI